MKNKITEIKRKSTCPQQAGEEGSAVVQVREGRSLVQGRDEGGNTGHGQGEANRRWDNCGIRWAAAHVTEYRGGVRDGVLGLGHVDFEMTSKWMCQAC